MYCVCVCIYSSSIKVYFGKCIVSCLPYGHFLFTFLFILFSMHISLYMCINILADMAVLREPIGSSSASHIE